MRKMDQKIKQDEFLRRLGIFHNNHKDQAAQLRRLAQSVLNVQYKDEGSVAPPIDWMVVAEELQNAGIPLAMSTLCLYCVYDAEMDWEYFGDCFTDHAKTFAESCAAEYKIYMQDPNMGMQLLEEYDDLDIAEE